MTRSSLVKEASFREDPTSRMPHQAPALRLCVARGQEQVTYTSL